MCSIIWYFVIYLCMISNISSQEDVLSDKVAKLTDLSFEKPLIRINNERFNHYVKTAPRNYSIIIMLTAMSPQRQCGICKAAYDEFQLVAQSYRYSNVFTNKLFFGVVDFDDGADVFQYLKLNSAPAFIHFPAKGKPKKSDQMDLNRWGFSADQICKWAKDRTEISIEITRPPNYSTVLLGGSLVVILVSFLYYKRNNLGFIYNTILWGLLVITVVCCFISGQTWNFINSPPFLPTHSHIMGIFADDSNMQYVAETYIVFLLYFGVSIGIILLNEAPKIRSRKGKRRAVMAIVGIVIVVSLFSYILSIFRAKYQGYPYSFLLK